LNHDQIDPMYHGAIRSDLVTSGAILETDRLLLRPHVMEDADALAAFLADPVAMEFYPAVLDRHGVKEWIGRNIERYQRDGFGRWAAVLKKSGQIIGSCGPVRQEVEGRDEIEVGYNILRALWGRGLATEAARVCTAYAFQKLGAQRVISMIRPENVRSVRVAEKNGMTCKKIVFWRGYDHCVYVKEKLG
jgi:RimJ/RimL family protein N-acetyltransferase